MFLPGGIDRTLRHMLFKIDGHPSCWEDGWGGIGGIASQVGGVYDFDALFCHLSAQRVSSVICIRLERLCVCVFHNLRGMSSPQIWHSDQRASEARRTGVKWIVPLGVRPPVAVSEAIVNWCSSWSGNVWGYSLPEDISRRSCDPDADILR